jgi:pimeloyl-ACP methyl ester carboxylesterase
MTDHVASRDGTTLAVDATGEGAPLILIGGAFNERSSVAALGARLAARFTVVSYDRRRRGASDDKAGDYLVANEIDDLAAVIEHVGGRAALFGHSSGAILALEAAVGALPVDRVAVYEPPYRADESLPAPGADIYDRLKALIEAGDLDGAAALFLGELIAMPASVIEGMKAGPAWPFLRGNAASLPYDVLLSTPWRLWPAERVAGIAAPVLAVYGDRTAPGLVAATRAVAASVPGAELCVLPGEDHFVLQRPGALAPVLTGFFER